MEQALWSIADALHNIAECMGWVAGMAGWISLWCMVGLFIASVVITTRD